MPELIYLSVCVLMVFVVARVVVLLDEAEVFLSLPLQDAVSPLCIGREVTLKKEKKITEKYIRKLNLLFF